MRLVSGLVSENWQRLPGTSLRNSESVVACETQVQGVTFYKPTEWGKERGVKAWWEHKQTFEAMLVKYYVTIMWVILR